MDSRSILRVFTIACFFLYCFADINKEEHVVDDKSTPATTSNEEDVISALTALLYNAVDEKNGTIGNVPASLIDLNAFEGKKLPDIVESLKNGDILNEKNLKAFQDSFEKSDDKLDVKTLKEIKDFFKNDTIFGGADTSDVTKLLEDKQKELEKEINKSKKSNGVKNFNGIFSTVISLSLIISVSY